MVIYKYLKKEHLLEFRSKGSILINTLYDLRKTEHEAICDEFEGRRQLIVGSDEKPTNLSVQDLHKLAPIIKAPEESKITIELEAGAIIYSNIEVSNAFVFCSSSRLDARLTSKFGYDAYYKITSPSRFAEAIFWKLDSTVAMNCFKIGAVMYSDNKRLNVTDANKSKITHNFWDICFTKPKRYSAESEFRMVFVPIHNKPIKPIIVSCPELLDYCAF